jgi:ketosteroid isomerase-like protein
MTTLEEKVRGAFPAFARRDVDALVALMAPDVEIVVAPAGLAGKPTVVRRDHYSGHAGLREWLREIAEDYTNLTLESREVEEDGDSILVLGTLAYEVGGTGGGMTVGWVCRFDGDRVARIETYWDWGEARAAFSGD